MFIVKKSMNVITWSNIILLCTLLFLFSQSSPVLLLIHKYIYLPQNYPVIITCVTSLCTYLTTGLMMSHLNIIYPVILLSPKPIFLGLNHLNRQRVSRFSGWALRLPKIEFLSPLMFSHSWLTAESWCARNRHIDSAPFLLSGGIPSQDLVVYSDCGRVESVRNAYLSAHHSEYLIQKPLLLWAVLRQPWHFRLYNLLITTGFYSTISTSPGISSQTISTPPKKHSQSWWPRHTNGLIALASHTLAKLGSCSLDPWPL